MTIDIMIKAVQDYVRRCMEPFAARIKALEDRPAPKDGEPGKDADPAAIVAAAKEAVAALPKPQDGKSVTAEELAPMVSEQVRAAVSAIPKPKDGEPGKSFTLEEVQVMVDAAVEKAVAALPAPKDGDCGPPGKDGAPGQRGSDGVAGKDGAAGADGKSVTLEEVRPVLDELFAKALPDWVARVDKAIADLPKPKDGEDGKSVTVEDFRHMFEAEQGKWALHFERRAQDILRGAIDKMPAPKDGRDALELEDLTVSHDGDGLVTLRFARGEVAKEFTLRLPRFKDQGVFREGTEYKEGDGTSWAGSFFIAQKDEPKGKPGESDDWRLAVKRGRDGKDLTPPVPTAAPVVRTR